MKNSSKTIGSWIRFLQNLQLSASTNCTTTCAEVHSSSRIKSGDKDLDHIQFINCNVCTSFWQLWPSLIFVRVRSESWYCKVFRISKVVGNRKDRILYAQHRGQFQCNDQLACRMTSGGGRKETTATGILKTRGPWASGRLHFLFRGN